MSQSRWFSRPILSLSLGVLSLGLPLWLASAAVASGGGGCEPPSSTKPTQPNRK
ncbi:hypothetical protein [Synechococcus elongatus]|nr:hypothetical protein [Synechococcus elongatus]MBD2586435.1 hypothetical protein [Synechococcus elongatus FACHB-242]MBD2687509.1 hypothetical protein [Synechococcus elongatus FACHB-1061]MBD2706782.1 hypothetical protein [Synechococcus elongatus PCC 7942 = FACHB-805]WKW04683.1 hypothetical protein QY054_08800 [Synechococcus elongatus PCC 7942 = FACHB-805]